MRPVLRRNLEIGIEGIDHGVARQRLGGTLGRQQSQQHILDGSRGPQGRVEIVVRRAEIEQAFEQLHVDFLVLGPKPGREVATGADVERPSRQTW